MQRRENGQGSGAELERGEGMRRRMWTGSALIIHEDLECLGLVSDTKSLVLLNV